MSRLVALAAFLERGVRTPELQATNSFSAGVRMFGGDTNIVKYLIGRSMFWMEG